MAKKKQDSYLHTIHECGPQFKDILVAEMVKTYILELPLHLGVETLNRVVSPCVGDVPVAKVQDEGIQLTVNGAELAELINNAKTVADFNTMMWDHHNQGQLPETTIGFLRNYYVSTVDSREYIEPVPDKIIDVLTDCWVLLAKVLGGVLLNVLHIRDADAGGGPSASEGGRCKGQDIAE